MAAAASWAPNPGDAGTAGRQHEIPTMDTFFIAVTLALVLLVVVGIGAIEMGADSRPGFDRSSPEA
jgi:hypothetical protein